MRDIRSILGSSLVEAEFRSLRATWSGREAELRAACDAAVRQVVSSPVGYGRLDVEPLLRERVWIPDPREVDVEGGAWIERALLDEAGDLLCAEIFDGSGALVETAYVVAPSVGRARLTFTDGYLEAVRLEFREHGVLEAVAETVGGIQWGESYERDAGGRVIAVRAVGPRIGPGPAEGISSEGVLTVAYSTSGEVASVTDGDGQGVYVASDLGGQEIVAMAAEHQVSECRAWFDALPFDVERLVVKVIDDTVPEPMMWVYPHGSDEPQELLGWESVTSEIVEAPQQVALAGYASFGGAVARRIKALFEDPAARPANVTATFAVELRGAKDARPGSGSATQAHEPQPMRRLPPPVQADVSRLVRVSVDLASSELEAWRSTETIAALALSFNSTEQDALCATYVWGLTADVRDALWREPTLPQDFWVAERWPVEFELPLVSDDDWALCQRLAVQLEKEYGVDWPPPYVIDRAARALATHLRETEIVRLTPDFLVFTYPEPDAEFIEASATFAVGPRALRTWRAAGCFDYRG